MKKEQKKWKRGVHLDFSHNSLCVCMCARAFRWPFVQIMGLMVVDVSPEWFSIPKHSVRMHGYQPWLTGALKYRRTDSIYMHWTWLNKYSDWTKTKEMCTTISACFRKFLIYAVRVWKAKEKYTQHIHKILNKMLMNAIAFDGRFSVLKFVRDARCLGCLCFSFNSQQ